MKKMWFIVLILAFSVSWAWAQGWPPLFETLDESRQRHSAERYEIYKERGYQAPLGGYPECLGDPAPPGTENPGFVTPRRSKPPVFNPFPKPRRHNPWSLQED
jgi:hypothetical protein